jgi:GDPmannose 4,6-dehydratase
LEFVTRKITDAVAKIHLGKLDVLEIGNLDAKRDWGFARDYVRGMHSIMQLDKPDTFVLATNRTEKVRYFVKLAFRCVGIELEFKGLLENEVGINCSNGKIVVRTNPVFYRPAEVDLLIGDSKKAKNTFGWEATTSLEELCEMMVLVDLERNRNA